MDAVVSVAYIVKCESVNRRSGLDGKIYESVYFSFPFSADGAPMVQEPWGPGLPYNADPSGHFSLENTEPGQYEVGKVYEFEVKLSDG